eukprot:2083944-Prymnesium_polylepis.1
MCSSNGMPGTHVEDLATSEHEVDVRCAGKLGEPLRVDAIRVDNLRADRVRPARVRVEPPRVVLGRRVQPHVLGADDLREQ